MEERYEKEDFCICNYVSGLWFCFSGTFGNKEKRAVRSFLSEGDYIEYIGDDGESTFIKASIRG
ncbi:MAG: hypothetical protein IKP60_02880 [Treponema sp.]|nr:hypothetical protein [Treponema sp.]